ncbi:F-box protein At3g07870-like [Rutidosis leptorrhynchoides]|uniref:F-box protein At3g07870-like n=1 Tax=Rutidosis leptorrhynchoides TaxID=125765 RepID=UPI003A98D0DE
MRRDVDDDSKKREYCRIVDDDDDTFPQNRISVRYPQFVGSSYGLLCFTGFYLGEDDDCYNRYIIWNPSIRKSVTIDVPYYKHVVVGFGVCPKSLDPKIVRIKIFKVPYDYNLGDTHMVWRVKVFTLNGGVWRRPLTKLPSKWFNVYVLCQTPVVVNGLIYWPAYCTRDNMIVSFDLETEEFTKIHVPSKVARRGFEIFKLRESIGTVRSGSKGRYVVWLMDYVSKSFIKLYTFSTLQVGHWNWKVVGFRDNDQLIIEKNGEYLLKNGVDRYVNEQPELVAYEPNAKQFNHLGFYFGCYSFTSYTESLLLLDQR